MTAMNEAKYIINITITQPTGSPIVIEPLGFIFLVIFTVLLVLQFIGMVMHRHETLLHILSITKLKRRKTGDIKEKIGLLAKDDVSYDSTSVNVKDEEEAIYCNEETIKRAAEDLAASRHAVPYRYEKRQREAFNLRKTVRKKLNYQHNQDTLNRQRVGLQNRGFQSQE